MTYQFHSYDSSFVRAYFTTRNADNQKLLYCIQDPGDPKAASFLRCTMDGEPWYSCDPVNHDWSAVEMPPDHGDRISAETRDFITKKRAEGQS